MTDVFLLSLTAALNPTLVAATTVMMLLQRPVRLMLGYLLGALMTSITLGIVIVFTIENSSTVSTTKRTLSPAATAALGVLMLVGAAVLSHGRPHRRHRNGEKKAKRDKGPPRWQQALDKGSPRITFVVGALLTLPGASYLAALTRIHKLDYSTSTTVIIIVAFNIIMLVLLEASLIAFAVAPDWTPKAIDRAKAWGVHHGLKVAVRVLAVLGALLVIKGAIEYVSQH